MIKPYPWGTHLLVAKDSKAPSCVVAWGLGSRGFLVFLGFSVQEFGGLGFKVYGLGFIGFGAGWGVLAGLVRAVWGPTRD